MPPPSSLEQAGFAVIPGVLDAGGCDELIDALAGVPLPSAGSRQLLASPWCAALAARLARHPALQPLLPPAAVAVQCTLFDKSPARNWLVSLHQDLSIPVRERVDAPGCSGWAEKEGLLYTQPPADVLQSLVALRLHLDDCGLDNGPLRVVPRSHTLGVIDAATVSARRDEFTAIDCPVPRGGVLAMRPLLLHASSKAHTPRHRRVLHFVFGPPALPLGLHWHWQH
jgi:hypothetical protein